MRFQILPLARAEGCGILAAACAGGVVSPRVIGLLIATVVIRVIMARTDRTRAEELGVLIDHQVVGSIRMAPQDIGEQCTVG